MGMVNKNEKPVTPLTELQVMAFAIQELALYLDTHRDDQEALEIYRAYQKAYHDAAMEYSRSCGPLTHKHPVEGPYKWLDDPWPWEYARNKEC
jgi:spore coat protein JB